MEQYRDQCLKEVAGGLGGKHERWEDTSPFGEDEISDIIVKREGLEVGCAECGLLPNGIQ